MVAIDYTEQMALVAVTPQDENPKILGIARYYLNPDIRTAEVTIAVRDECQNKGVGRELLAYLTYLAKKNGLVGFTAEVLVANAPMLRLFKKMGFDIETVSEDGGVYELNLSFR
jgi:ribosomal protein S18 acetylase RimI-like enzyme